MTTQHQQHRAPRPWLDDLPGMDWIRRNKLTAGIIGGAIALIVIALIVIAASSGSSVAHPVKAPATASATNGTTWVDGAANTNLNAVNAGVIALTNAKTKGDLTAFTTAGTRLAHAATVALAGAMPPVDAGVYRTALGALIRAGHDAAAGKLAAATPLVNDGIAGLIKVTAAANAPKTP
jgi:hypothetical protein